MCTRGRISVHAVLQESGHPQATVPQRSKCASEWCNHRFEAKSKNRIVTDSGHEAQLFPRYRFSLHRSFAETERREPGSLRRGRWLSHPAKTTLDNFSPSRNLPDPQERLNQRSLSADDHLREALDHGPSGTSGSASSQRANNPSCAVEISRCRTRFTRCAINASGMRSRRIRGIAHLP